MTPLADSPETVARWDALKRAPTTCPTTSLAEGVIEGGEGGDDGSFGAQNLLA
jgi:hypothetical protein